MDVAIPSQLTGRPRDAQGRPVGFAVGWRDGQPLQGTNVGAKVARCIIERLCGLCGGPLGYWVAFIGDASCVVTRVFYEPPMCVECARYALAVCPYLATADYESHRERDGVAVIADRRRPERMALYLTRGFAPNYDSDVPSAKAEAPRSIEWY